MKTGPEYLYSGEKKALDLTAVITLSPLGAAAVQAAKWKFIPKEDPTLIQVLRAGAGGMPILIDKIRTLDPKTGDVYPHPLASFYRRTGIDEIVQIRQIREGSMSMVGRRALAPQDQIVLYDRVSHDREGSALVDRHRSTVALTRPGLISSTGINRHADQELTPDECLALDIEDYENANLGYDLSLMAEYLRKVMRHQLKNNNIPLTASLGSDTEAH